MTTLKPLPGGKSKEQVYFDEILEVYGAEKIKPKGELTPYEALEALKKHLNDKKAAKAKVVAKVNALDFKKKGVHSTFKLKEVPYEAVKGFYQFSVKPNFVVIGVASKEIPKQYIILAAPKAEKLDRLFDVLQTSQLTPGHKLNKPVPPVNDSLIAVVGAESESPTLRSRSENRRSATSTPLPALQQQTLEPSTESSRSISYRTETTRSPSPQRQPSRTRTESRTSAISYTSKHSVASSLSSHHQRVPRSLSSSSSSLRSRPTPTPKGGYSSQRSASSRRSSSSTIPAACIQSSIATPPSILVSQDKPVEYNETKSQFIVYRPSKYKVSMNRPFEFGGLVNRKPNYYSSESSSDESDDANDRSTMKTSKHSERSPQKDDQKPKQKSDLKKSQYKEERLSSKIYYFLADREEFSSSDSDSDSIIEENHKVKRVSSKLQPRKAPSKRRNRSSSSSSSSPSISTDTNSRASSIYRVMRY
ncbi:hypothetical protein TcWFU_004091 [Taenia crassiceps]|uniref:Trematode PH-like domain-containing protein n=1 Tax=Taenia crassiceps TaxID=6207 RepID=A0ABR4QR19_9CEST